MKIKIGSKRYDVIIAEDEKSKIEGLQGLVKMEDNEGMLFIYDEPAEITFWMKDVFIPLDIIFIDEEFNVISIAKGEPDTETEHTEKNVQYILEVNQNSGINIDDELELDDFELSPNSIHVIGPDGKSQMELEGGERIFSRNNTKVLINMAKRAFLNKDDKSYKILGKQLFKYLKIQDSNKPEYTKKER